MGGFECLHTCLSQHYVTSSCVRFARLCLGLAVRHAWFWVLLVLIPSPQPTQQDPNGIAMPCTRSGCMVWDPTVRDTGKWAFWPMELSAQFDSEDLDSEEEGDSSVHVFRLPPAAVSNLFMGLTPDQMQVCSSCSAVRRTSRPFAFVHVPAYTQPRALAFVPWAARFGLCQSTISLHLGGRGVVPHRLRTFIILLLYTHTANKQTQARPLHARRVLKALLSRSMSLYIYVRKGARDENGVLLGSRRTVLELYYSRVLA